MIGLIALGILGFWSFLSYKISKFLTMLTKIGKNNKFAHLVIFLLVFCAPVADEIVGGFQFRLLCNKDSVAFVNEEKAKDKTLLESSLDEKLVNYFVPIEKFTYFYKDINTSETVVSYIYYRATGGWLARTINLGTSHPPFIFNGDCAPTYSGTAINRKLNIKLQPQPN